MQSKNEMLPDTDIAWYKVGGLALWAMASCYLFLFIIFGAILSFPQTGNITDNIQYITEHQSLLNVAYFVGYLVFGCLLLTAVQVIHQQLNNGYSLLLNSASLLGLIWVVLMMCSGMIAIVGMDKMVTLHTTASEQAISLFYAYNTLVDSLGGGIELVGALWVLLLSIVSLKSDQFPKVLSYLGGFIGVIGILTIFQSVPEFKDVFGLSQIVWFIWLGFALIKKAP